MCCYGAGNNKAPYKPNIIGEIMCNKTDISVRLSIQAFWLLSTAMAYTLSIPFGTKFFFG